MTAIDDGTVIQDEMSYNRCCLQLLSMMAQSSEFEQMAVREEEMIELDTLARDCPFDVKGGPENKHGKANILLQVATRAIRARYDLIL